MRKYTFSFVINSISFWTLFLTAVHFLFSMEDSKFLTMNNPFAIITSEKYSLMSLILSFISIFTIIYIAFNLRTSSSQKRRLLWYMLLWFVLFMVSFYIYSSYGIDRKTVTEHEYIRLFTLLNHGVIILFMYICGFQVQWKLNVHLKNTRANFISQWDGLDYGIKIGRKLSRLLILLVLPIAGGLGLGFLIQLIFEYEGNFINHLTVFLSCIFFIGFIVSSVHGIYGNSSNGSNPSDN